MIKKFAKALRQHKILGLISHVNPDGDTIGSQLALYNWLTQNGIDALLFNDDPVPPNLVWLAHQEKIRVADAKMLDQCDGFLFVDGNHPSRFGAMSDYFEKTDKPVYLIDHHPDPPHQFFREKLWDAGVSSTACLVYTLYKETGLGKINKETAEALYSGIVTDTGSFRFASVTAETHFIIGDIIKIGGLSPSEIHERIYDDKNLSQYQLLGLVLQNIRLHCNNQVATIYVTQEMLTETGCILDDLEGFVNYPLSIKGVLVSVIFYERDDLVKISLRGKSAIDLNKTARVFQGGGHFNAAGAWLPGPLEKAIPKVVAEIASRIEGQK